MAHPLFIIEQAVCQFSSQWYAGLRPSLEILTQYDGSLVVSSRMICSNKPPPFDWSENSASQFQFTSTPKSKRAKKNARYRRNRARTTKDVETQFSNSDDGAPINETENVDSGFNENSCKEKAASVSSKVPPNFSDGDSTEKDEVSAMDDSVTPNTVDALMESPAAGYDCDCNHEEFDGTLEHCPENTNYENCLDAQVGSGFSDKKNDKSKLSKATYVPPNSPEASKNKTVTSEVSHQNSTAAIHQSEGCLKEFDRTLEQYPNNLNCKDCIEETRPKYCSCNEDHICQTCKDYAEEYFCLVLESKKLLPKQQNKTVKRSRSDKRKKNLNCFFCENLAANGGSLVIDNMKLLLGCINVVENPPCMECKIFFYKQSWFSPEEMRTCSQPTF